MRCHDLCVAMTFALLRGEHDAGVEQVKAAALHVLLRRRSRVGVHDGDVASGPGGDVSFAALHGLHWLSVELAEERPLLLVIKKPGQDVTKEQMLEFLADKIVKWWMPDEVLFVAELPHTPTGKLLKRDLRETFKDVYTGH